MKKTLVRFLGGAVIAGGTLLALASSASAQSTQIIISPLPQDGPSHQPLTQVIRVTNMGGADATGLTVTFTVPKGAKVDSPCQFDRFHGVGSYTCLVGSLQKGQTAEVTFSISMNKSDDISVEATCDQGTFSESLSITIF